MAWYRQEVCLAFDAGPMKGCGYSYQFDRAVARTEDGGLFLELEPVGFALVGKDGELVMNDCGSDPSPGRARVLSYYQAPLTCVDAGEGVVRFERFVRVVGSDVEPEPGHPGTK